MAEKWAGGNVPRPGDTIRILLAKQLNTLNSLPVGATTVETPTASPSGGNFTSSVSVTLACATSGASIYYTTNGANPTTASTLYSSPFTVSTSSTVKAIGIKSGLTNSAVASFAFFGSVATPTASPDSGDIAGSTSVTLACSTAGSAIYYTTDGSIPTTSSTLYSSPVAIVGSKTLKFFATRSGLEDSVVITKTYVDTTLSTPSGFTGTSTDSYASTMKLYRSSLGVYTTNLVAADYKTANIGGTRTDTLYCDAVSGNDANAGTSVGAACKTWDAMVAKIGSYTGKRVEYVLAPGNYSTATTYSKAISVWITASSGTARLIAKGKWGTDWVADTAPRYKITSYIGTAVYDFSNLGTDGSPQKLTLVANAAAVSSTAGSWYTDGVDTWVRAFDDRVPDTNLIATAGLSSGVYQARVSGYYKSIKFINGGSNHPAVWHNSTAADAVSVYDGCWFVGGASSGGCLKVEQDTGTCFTENCKAYHAVTDGFNYHKASTYSNFFFIENGNVSGHCGSALADNGSTCHDGIWGVRLNGAYQSNASGRAVHDIGAGGTWNLACSASNATNGWTVGSATPTTKMWLDGCTTSGNSTWDFNIDPSGSTMYYRNIDLTGKNVSGSPVPY